MFGWALALALPLGAGPANDHFRDGIVIETSGATARVAGTTAGATREENEPYHATGLGSVWYRWTPTESGRLQATTRSGNASHGVFTGTNVASLAWAALEDGLPYVEAGRENWIAVYENAGMPDEFDIQLRFIAVPPANDNFAQAIELPSVQNQTIEGTTLDATLEPGEAAAAGSSGSVWYRFTAPVGGVVRFQAVAGGPRPALYAGSSTAAADLKAAQTFEAGAGETFYISVSKGEAKGEAFRLGLEVAPLTPANDTIGNAREVLETEGAVLLSGTTFGATEDAHESIFLKGAGVWFKWRPTVTGQTELIERGGRFQYAILSRWGEHWMMNTTNGVAKVTAGLDYYIGIYGPTQTETSPFRAIFRVVAASDMVRPANDHFADATELTEQDGKVVVKGTTKGGTLEAGEPAARGTSTVWFRWRPTGNWRPGSITWENFEQMLPPVFYSGNSLAALQKVWFRSVVPGQTYYIAVAHAGSPGVNFEFTIHAETAEDHPVEAIELTGAAGTTPLAFRPYELNVGYAPWAYGESRTQGVSALYKWTPSINSVFHLFASRPNNLVETVHVDIFTETDKRVEVFHAGDIHWGQEWFLGNAGQTYYIRFSAAKVIEPRTLSWIVRTIYHDFGPLLNDNFAEALPIDPSARFFVTYVERARMEPGEPAPAPGATRTTWFSWKAPADGMFWADTFGFGRYLTLFSGTAIGNLQALPMITGPIGGAPVSKGEIYYLRLEAIYDWTEFNVSLSFTARPPNDDFATARQVAESALNDSVWGGLATAEAGEPAHLSGPQKSVWWHWTPDRSGAVEFTGIPWTMIGVYAGEHLQFLRQVALGSGFGFTANLTAGQDYFIAVALSSETLAYAEVRTMWEADRPVRLPQSIEFAAPAETAYAPAPILLEAQANSGLPVVFSIHSGDGWLDGNQLYAHAPGVLVIRAEQSGNEQHLSAPPIFRSIVIRRAAQTVHFAPVIVEGQAREAQLVATASSGLPVSFEVLSGPGRIAGNVLENLGEGPIVVGAWQAGDAFFARSETAIQTVVLSRLPQEIALEILPASGSRAALRGLAGTLAPTNFEVIASASSRLPVWLEVMTGNATIMEGSLVVTAPGEIVVRASQAGDAVFMPAVLDRRLNPAKEAQHIQFEALAEVVYGTGPIALSGTASSGLPVQYTVVAGEATVEGNTLTVHAAGRVRVRAEQTGDEQFDRAEPVERSFEVLKAGQTIRFNELQPVTFGSAPVVLAAVASSGLPVRFEVAMGKATLDGNRLIVLGAGSVRIRASQSGNENYLAAEPVERMLVVQKAAQRIEFAELPQLTLGGAPVKLNAQASSGLEVAFELAAGKGAVAGGVLTMGGAGTMVIRAMQPGSDDYLAAEPVEQSIAVGKAGQRIDFPAMEGLVFGGEAARLEAIASSGLPVEFELLSGKGALAGNALTAGGAGTLTIRAAQSGNDDYLAAEPVERTLTFAKAAQSIEFAALAGTTFGSGPVKLPASASSQLPVEFEVASGKGEIAGDEVSILGAGTIVVRARQSGNEDYAEAPPVEQTLKVAKARQTLQYMPLPELRHKSGPALLRATASSGLPAKFEAVFGPIEVNGSVLKILGPGPASVKAFQPGSEDYLPSPSVTDAFVIGKALQRLELEAPDYLAPGMPPQPVRASSDAGLPVELRVAAGAAELAGGMVEALGMGDIVLRAFQGGDDNHEAATLDRTIRVLGPPNLEVSRSGGGLVLEWPRSHGGFGLEMTTSLDGKWTKVEAAAREEGERCSVRLETGPGRLFFRLRR